MTLRKRIRRRIVSVIAAIIAVLTIAAPSAYADMQGVDISNWQCNIDTYNLNADFVIAGTTWGVGGFNNTCLVNGVNTDANRQLSQAKASGKSIGVYHYAQGNNATAEADFFIDNVAGYVGDAVLVLDWEAQDNRAWGNGNWVAQWVDRVHDRTRVWPIIYVQASAIGQIPQSVWDKCGLWVAQYASNAATGYQSRPWLYGAYGEAMRQYTSNGVVSGYGGRLDLNVFRGDRAAWNAYAKGDGATTPKPQPEHTTTGSNTTSSTGTRQCVTVQPGQSLSGIAAQYGGVWSDWTGYRSGNPSLIYAGETVCRGGAPPSANAVSPAPQSGGLRVTVRAGDTISAIAARNNAYPLTAWSVPSGNINLIYPGQVVVYNGSATSSAAPGGRVHIIRSGECLSMLFPSTWRSVAAANGITNPNLVYPGQRIVY